MSSEILDKWKTFLVYFLKKLQVLNSKRLVLKSHPHLGRMITLYELFPEAQFIHIVRHPYSVYSSTKKLWKSTLAYSFLQEIDEEFIDHFILTMYSELFSSFERQRKRIPPDFLHELKFEDLVQEPRKTLQLMYGKMELPGFERFWPKVESYLKSISDYRKNIYQLDENSKRIVQRRWDKTFNRYGYSR